MAESPEVAILMGVYRPTRKGLAKTVDSVLAQSYVNFELLIVQDDDLPETGVLLQELARRDSRIRLFHNKENKGLVVSLNLALTNTIAPFIARIDVGDYWLEDKLAKQVALLRKNEELVLIGTQYLNITQDGTLIDVLDLPGEDVSIREWLAAGRNPFVHSAIVFRRFPGMYYNEQATHTEDFELWCRFSFLGLLHNIAEPLTYYLFDIKSITGANRYLMYCNATQVYSRYLVNRQQLNHQEIRDGFAISSKHNMNFLQQWGSSLYSRGRMFSASGKIVSGFLYAVLAVLVAPGFLVQKWRRLGLKRLSGVVSLLFFSLTYPVT